MRSTSVAAYIGLTPRRYQSGAHCVCTLAWSGRNRRRRPHILGVLAGRKFAAQRGLSRRLNPQGSIRPPTARKPARRAVGTKVRGAFSPTEPRALRPLSRRCYRVAANRKGTRSCDGPTACGIARSQPGTTQRCAEPRTRSAQPFAARSISVRARQRCVCGANRSCSAPKWRLRVSNAGSRTRPSARNSNPSTAFVEPIRPIGGKST